MRTAWKISRMRKFYLSMWETRFYEHPDQHVKRDPSSHHISLVEFNIGNLSFHMLEMKGHFRLSNVCKSLYNEDAKK